MGLPQGVRPESLGGGSKFEFLAVVAESVFGFWIAFAGGRVKSANPVFHGDERLCG